MKLFGRRNEPQDAHEEHEAAPCEHMVRTPTWDRAEDVGREDLASGYRCETCGANLSSRDVARIQATESERLKRRVSA
jgi:hypothetical protein